MIRLAVVYDLGIFLARLNFGAESEARTLIFGGYYLLLSVAGTRSTMSVTARRELVFLLLQYLDDEEYKETVHK